jgi:hypothetical protein
MVLKVNTNQYRLVSKPTAGTANTINALTTVMPLPRTASLRGSTKGVEEVTVHLYKLVQYQSGFRSDEVFDHAWQLLYACWMEFRGYNSDVSGNASSLNLCRLGQQLGAYF